MNSLTEAPNCVSVSLAEVRKGQRGQTRSVTFIAHLAVSEEGFGISQWCPAVQGSGRLCSEEGSRMRLRMSDGSIGRSAVTVERTGGRPPTLKRVWRAALAVLVGVSATAVLGAAPALADAGKVLVFTGTAGTANASSADVAAAITALGAANDFTVDTTSAVPTSMRRSWLSIARSSSSIRRATCSTLLPRRR